MVTTFVRSTGGRSKGVWSLIEKTSRANIRLAEMEHSSLKNIILLFRAGPLDVRGVFRDSRVTTELDIGSLRHTLGILTHEDFHAVVDNE